MLSNLVDSRNKSDEGALAPSPLELDPPPSPLSSDPDRPLTLRVKCSAPDLPPNSDYAVTTTGDSTVRSLKEDVRGAVGQRARGRYLRLISGGRLLAPDGASVSSFKLQDGGVVHAVLAAAGVRGGQQSLLSEGHSPGRRNRTGVTVNGLALRRSNSAEEDSDEETGGGERERRGFDRLRRGPGGMSRAEVSAIRLYFSGQVDRFIAERERERAENGEESDPEDGEGGGEETPLERRRRLEEEWMDAQGPNSEFRLNLNASNPLLAVRGPRVFLNDDAMPRSVSGTDRDFLWGVVLGFFVGYVMMFWVWLPTVPHKQKLGILTGISLQLALNLLRAKDANDSLDD